MAVRFVPVEGAFTGTSPVTIRSMAIDATDSVLVGFSFLNNGATDVLVLVRHLIGATYSGAYQELVVAGQSNKAFTPGCLGMDGGTQSIEAQLDVAGTFRWQAVFRETYS